MKTPRKSSEGPKMAQAITNPRELMTVREAASALRVNPSTVRRWISDGTLTGIRIGKATLRLDLSTLKYESIGAAA